MALWLTPEESARQRLWRGQRIDNRLRANQIGETRGYRHSHHQSPHAFSGIFACGSWGSPGYGGWPLIKINSFHNNIWFDSDYLLATIVDDSNVDAILGSILIKRLLFWSKLFFLLANTSFTICWKLSKSKELSVFSITCSNNTNIGKLGSIQSILCIIPLKIHLTIIIMNNKGNQISRSQSINMWNATYSNILSKHGLL